MMIIADRKKAAMCKERCRLNGDEEQGGGGLLFSVTTTTAAVGKSVSSSLFWGEFDIVSFTAVPSLIISVCY